MSHSLDCDHFLYIRHQESEEGRLCRYRWAEFITWTDIDFFVQDIKEIEKYRDRVDFHIVGASQGLYPVNTLRWVATRTLRCLHV